MTKAKAKKLDVFKVLEKIDLRQKEYYTTLTEEEKKSMSMWVLTRWMSSTKGMMEHHLLMVNDIVNDEAPSLSKHPELQWKLLCICGTGKKQFHQWIAPPKRLSSNKKEEALSEMNPSLNRAEVELLSKMTSDDDMRDLLYDMGYQEKQVIEILGKVK